MKTLIVYASKYGAAGEAAKRIANRLDGADVRDLKGDEIPSLADYDCIVAGSAIYAGQVRKELKAFLAQHEAGLLKGKGKLGLFVCGLEQAEADNVFKNNFSAEVLQTAQATAFLGGRFDPKKANAAERFIMKAIAKKAEYVDTLDDEAIRCFVEEIK